MSILNYLNIGNWCLCRCIEHYWNWFKKA